MQIPRAHSNIRFPEIWGRACLQVCSSARLLMMPEDHLETQYCFSHSKPSHTPSNSEPGLVSGALRWAKAETKPNTASSVNKMVIIAQARIESGKVSIMIACNAPDPRLSKGIINLNQICGFSSKNSQSIKEERKENQPMILVRFEECFDTSVTSQDVGERRDACWGWGLMLEWVINFHRWQMWMAGKDLQNKRKSQGAYV